LIESPSTAVVWNVVGITGGLIFYGRFYVQWIASERAGRSVMPLLFWYMSCIGSIALLAFAVASQSPLGALGQNFNIVVYGRNLLHIWREQGTLTRRRHWAVYGAMVAVGTAGIGLLIYVWLGEYRHVQQQPAHVSRPVWMWLAVGVLGQVLFAARFLVQWLASEKQRRSVIPISFWYLSLAASTLQAVAFLQRGEWVFGIGMLATIVIYLRNVWLVNQERLEQAAAA